MALEIFGKNGWVAIILLAALYLVGAVAIILAFATEEETLLRISQILLMFLAPLMILVVAVLNMIEKKFDLLSIIATAVTVPGIMILLYGLTVFMSNTFD